MQLENCKDYWKGWGFRAGVTYLWSQTDLFSCQTCGSVWYEIRGALSVSLFMSDCVWGAIGISALSYSTSTWSHRVSSSATMEWDIIPNFYFLFIYFSHFSTSHLPERRTIIHLCPWWIKQCFWCLETMRVLKAWLCYQAWGSQGTGDLLTWLYCWGGHSYPVIN